MGKKIKKHGEKNLTKDRVERNSNLLKEKKIIKTLEKSNQWGRGSKLLKNMKEGNVSKKKIDVSLCVCFWRASKDTEGGEKGPQI